MILRAPHRIRPAAARCATVAAVLLSLASAGMTQDIPADLARADLAPGWRGEAGVSIAAVRFTLAQGWHTYWRSPGEGGIPPRFDWTGSTNLRSVAFRWPAPQVFDLNGLRTLGYEDRLILPIEVTPVDPDQPVSLAASVDIGVCDEICVPVTLTFAGQLSRDKVPDPAILAAMEAAPIRRDARATCSAEPIRDGLRLTIRTETPALAPGEFSVIEMPGSDFWVSPSTDSRSGAVLTSVADMVPPDAMPFALDRSRVRLTLFGGGQVVEFNGCTG